MIRHFGRAALLAACLLGPSAKAQDVTLTARDGSLALQGSLLGFDGEFYRIDTSYGVLTVDGQGVLCDGPGCPDLVAPKARLRVVGEGTLGASLMPALVAAFARARGLTMVETHAPWQAELRDPVSGQTLAEITWETHPAETARKLLQAGAAELVLAAATDPSLGHRPVALDALVPIVAPGNRLARIATPDLARALGGEIGNWADLGGPDMPIVLHGLAPDSDLGRAMEQRLGKALPVAQVHPDMARLAQAVAADPWALAVTGQSATGAARALPMADSCGFPLLPDAASVKAEDYPLTLPVHFLTPRRRLPLMVRDFLAFLAEQPAQDAIAALGLVDRSAERRPMTADGLRLINAIKGAGTDTTLEDLKRLVGLMDGADRLSLTFRFRDGSTDLDVHSRQNLEDLARLIEIDAFRGERVILAGFSDGSGDARANLDLSRNRAEAVLAALGAALPESAQGQLPEIAAFGEAMPMACDETAAGRRLNRRVELWLRPAGQPDR